MVHLNLVNDDEGINYIVTLRLKEKIRKTFSDKTSLNIKV